MNNLKAPFPYFGGKQKIAHIVWAALGSPKHYIEPFGGSAAVLLLRPGYDPNIHTETYNDADSFLANVWRSLKWSPDETAEWCDWPISHVDLCARRQELIRNEERLLENLKADPKWHDPVMAGYWIWAASCWIGSGLTKGNKGVTAIGQRPHLTDNRGVTAIGQIPQLDHDIGVNTIGKRPRLTGFAETGVMTKTAEIYSWFQQLSARLRRVRVTCGDWSIVCGGNWQDNLGICGIFMDPPYGIKDRDTALYHHDSTDVAAAVNAWCLERGKLPLYRIVLTGYEEHQNLLEHGWTAQAWKANGGYGNQSKTTGRTGNQNEKREMIYFSPNCLINQVKLDL